ncbi:MAG: hypothetical protein IPL91_06575 [Hyphomicrobium sp.]|jgi:uncharacterized membrane-anchored protein YhcB (DUF1043 family)|nr:hypothetical protein [Hyphomicrobium sp.]
MYLLTQVWWYLLLAFLLGALIGYLLWRMCSRPMLEARFEQSRKAMADRLALLEEEHARLAAGRAPSHAPGNGKTIQPKV